MKKLGLVVALIVFLLCVPFSVGCGKGQTTRTNYQINCSLNGNCLSGTETVDFYNFTDNSFTELKFNLFGNAFRKGAKYKPVSAQYEFRAYPNGINYGEMSVTNVLVDGQSSEYKISGEDQNVLVVTLLEELFPEERVSVQIDFSLTLANVIARTGVNGNTINLGNFYPILCGIDKDGFYECVYYSSGDPFFSDCADYQVVFDCEEKYVVASSGREEGVKIENGRKQTTYSLSNARSFAIVVSENFNVIKDDSLGVNIIYYYYQDSDPKSSLDYAIKSMRYFEKTFGEYPYSTYSVVQTEFMQGGMEYPALVMISDDLEVKAYGEVIVHETAHQWWQTTVGNNEIEYGFLDEGLAEYSVVLFYENHPEYGMERKKLIASSEQTYKVFCSVYDKLFGKVNTVMIRKLGDFNGEYEYVNMAYVKPCIMYDYLRETIGDATFFKGLKRYYEQYSFTNATPYDLAGAFEKVGADSNGFFESFFNGKVII